MRQILLSASLMCADFKHLEKDLKIFEKEGIDFIHTDIMDGHFVPNITLSPLMVKSLKGIVTIPFDAHLMVENPDVIIDQLFDIDDVEIFTLHIESISNYAFRTIKSLREGGKKVGIALNPATPIDALKYLYPLIDKVTIMTVDPGFAGQRFIPEMMEKIKKLNNLRREHGYSFLIEVDGGIGEWLFPDLIKNGVDVLVLGTSALFSDQWDLRERIRYIKDVIDQIIWENIDSKHSTS